MVFKLLGYFVAVMFAVDLLGINYQGYNLGANDEKCLANNGRLLTLLNLLCNQTQNTSVSVRDACYGCFFRIANLPGGQTMLNDLSNCANLYLRNTSYAGCANQLANLVTGIRPTQGPSIFFCYTGYCEFARCIRRQNAVNLLDSCFQENLFRDQTTQQGRVTFYTNVTSCLLARARCSTYNPITGDLQIRNNLLSLFGQQQPRLSNAIQVTNTGNLRIVSFPNNAVVAPIFCSGPTTLRQAPYGLTDC